ncbi:FAD-dependent thymidylate synthase [bacterium]|nr:FAD-dependent thymidylate synthase [bacterium]
MSARVRLVEHSRQSYDFMVAAARTCYSARGIVAPEQVAAGPPGAPAADRHVARDRLARSIFEAGHHTTLQHGQVQFALEGVSRLFIWSFLHAHPFYNSEQVSQRYVPVAPAHHYRPALVGAAAAIYDAQMARASAAYRELAALLEPRCRELYLERFPARRRSPRLETDPDKLALEAARYVLPLATTAYLYHTVSVLTLFRYWRLAEQRDAPAETRAVIGAMVEALLAAVPDYAKLIEEPIPLDETPEAAFFAGREPPPGECAAFRAAFDADLAGHASRLVAASEPAEALVAAAVRETLGLPAAALGDEEAIALCLDPARNRLWGETLNLATLDRLARPLHHVHYSFRRRISHTADSQDQRHRMTPASRPSLLSQENGEPDYILPSLVARVPAAARLYHETMARNWEAIARFRAAGGSAEDALYLLPNAKCLRYTESADLLNFHHKAAMRLCYNAQEEIWRLTLEEALQIRDRHPRLGRYLLPPCGLRQLAGSHPLCPEGDRYCGVPVWRLDPADYERSL